MEGRKFCTTNTGYICMVPETVERGDVVVVLLGCNFPVLLRPYESKYRVVGECYVHELMQGEIFDGKDDAVIEYQDFVLV
jgi:hypothetical protein